MMEPHHSNVPLLVLVCLPLTVGIATPIFNLKKIRFFFMSNSKIILMLLILEDVNCIIHKKIF